MADIFLRIIPSFNRLYFRQSNISMSPSDYPQKFFMQFFLQ